MQLKRNNAPGRGTPASVMWPRIFVVSAVFLLVILGLVMVYSASSVVNIDAGVEAHADALRQLVYAGIGVAACLFIAFVIPHRAWQGPLTWIALGISVVLLVLTAAIGTESLGAQRWLTLGPASMQPSEFAKIGVLLAAAKLVADYQDGHMEPRAFLISFGALNLLVVGLVFLAQSDLGTTLICFIGMVAILWLAEAPLRYIGMYVALIAAFGTAGLLAVSYRLERLLIFTHPWDDYYGSGYQIIHSMYAFSQGGLTGVGLGNSAEKYLYLPEASTDFIFSIVGEELGFVGAFGVIALFIVLLVAGLRMAQAAPDRFGGVLCGSLAIIIVFQAFLNIGCVIGVMPITGKPLPFVSAGGSSLIASFMMVGIMLSVSLASGESPVYAQRRADIRPLPREGRAAASGRHDGSYGGRDGRVRYGSASGAASAWRAGVAGSGNRGAAVRPMRAASPGLPLAVSRRASENARTGRRAGYAPATSRQSSRGRL